MSKRTRSILVFLAKALVATLLITWLIRSGSLDFGKLSLLFEKPLLLVVDLGLFGLGVFMGALRWRVLLGLAGAKVPLARAVQLQFTAQFFNSVIPGGLGGDVVKALYVARDNDPSKRTTILLIVFVERLIGLAALVLVASFIAVLRGPMLWATPQLRQLAMAVATLGACVIVGPIVLLVIMRRAGARLEAWTSGPSKLAKLAGQLVAAARLLASGPKGLLKALAISMCTHVAAMTYFMLLARSIAGEDISFSAVATVYPLGMLTLAVPISPVGLGVGHMAFDRLFGMIGLSGGANVFNVFLISQVVPNLLGVFPYLALRRQGALPTAAEAAGATEATEAKGTP